jgi:heme A synthase
MTDDRKSGLVLIIGSLGGILTMAIHPTSAGVLTPAQFERLAIVSAIAHSLAMFSFVVLFLGAIGLMQRLALRQPSDKRNHFALAALVTYGFAAVAVMIATAVSGFIVPQIMRHMIRDAPANAPQWRMIIDAIFQINQTFSRIYSVAASIAILLWSISALRNGGLGRVTAIYGCVVGLLFIALVGSGYLPLNVHGMAMVVLAHAIWLISVGAQLCRHPERTTPATGGMEASIK